ncbi:hypothetical protein BCR34DRAFT_592403 [Clohesyomyces aquaticus]|uniref:Uncharacterized protein n=1 Tax=Clohesyomyces aquaticus TaxID=1231657 RepID=A0A1Y1YSE0_9PLEO|nr:hypothetical protein BCR34DRAFT_592403 [Clohesyomyces aquaticus]
MDHALVRPCQDSLPSTGTTDAPLSPHASLLSSSKDRHPSVSSNSGTNASSVSQSGPPSFSSSSPNTSSLLSFSATIAGARRGPTSPGHTHPLAPDREAHQPAPSDRTGSRWTAINQLGPPHEPSNSQNPFPSTTRPAHSSHDARKLEDPALSALDTQPLHQALSQPSTSQPRKPQETDLPRVADQPAVSRENLSGAKSILPAQSTNQSQPKWLSTLLDPPDRASSTPPTLSGEKTRTWREKGYRHTFPPARHHPARKPDAPSHPTTDRKEMASAIAALGVVPSSNPPRISPNLAPKEVLMTGMADPPTLAISGGSSDSRPSQAPGHGTGRTGRPLDGETDSRQGTSQTTDSSQSRPSTAMSPPTSKRHGYPSTRHEDDSYSGAIEATQDPLPSDSPYHPAPATTAGDHASCGGGCNRLSTPRFEPTTHPGPISYKRSLKLQEELANNLVNHRLQQEEADRACANARRCNSPPVDVSSPPRSLSAESEGTVRGAKRKEPGDTPPLPGEEPPTKKTAAPNPTLDNGNSLSVDPRVMGPQVARIFGHGNAVFQPNPNDWRNMWHDTNHGLKIDPRVPKRGKSRNDDDAPMPDREDHS